MTTQPQIALTFDDGPNGQATRRIVDILVDRHVPATFFQIGKNISADLATARYVHQAGFVIANHSWDHSFLLPWQSAAAIEAGLKKTNEIITATTGQRPALFRPPHGWQSGRLRQAVGKENLRLVTWTIDPFDYFPASTEQLTKRVLHRAHDGGIILMHDGLFDGPFTPWFRQRQATIAALPAMIDQLRAAGYSLVDLATLLQRNRG